MKKLQRFFAVIALTLALALSASAGDILGPGAKSPLPPPPPPTIETGNIETPGATVKGDILTPGVAELDPVTEAALSLLQSILSLF